MPFIKSADDYSKPQLNALIDQLKQGDENVRYELIVFTLAESRGTWHGRARAKICRHLKNHPPDATRRAKLVEVVCNRLKTGNFSEQFRDQLRMAIKFEPDRMRKVAESLLTSETEHVRRFATWVLNLVGSNDAK